MMIAVEEYVNGKEDDSRRSFLSSIKVKLSGSFVVI